MSALITLTDVQKFDGRQTLLDIPALRVKAGEIAAVIGPAGSGLDTLMALLTGRERPTAGEISLAGIDPVRDPAGLSRRIGVMFADDPLYKTRSPRGNLAFHARLRGLPAERVDEVLVDVGLADQARAKIDEMPTGLWRRLSFGLAILHRPPVLLLRDPFSRCDEATITLLGDQIGRHAAGGGAALLLTRTDSYLFNLGDTLYTLDQGRIVGRRRPQEEQTDVPLPFKIPVKLEGRVALLNPADILFAVAEEGQILLHTHEEKLPSQFTLAELETRLARSGFFRAHRSYLVNLQHVIEVIPFTRSSYSLRLDDREGTLVPLSKESAAELRALLDY